MSDPFHSKPKIPSWQHQAQSSVPEQPPSQESDVEQQQETDSAKVPNNPATPGTEQSSSEASSGDQDELLDQARKFLEEPGIQTAPDVEKKEFLKSKGVSTENIGKLIASSDNPERLHNSHPAPGTTGMSRPSSQSRPSPNVPPVITYPEFLLHAQEPPPLVTARRLVTTAYFTGGLVAAFYGLSKYIVGPMAETLSEARHDFATHGHAHIQDLNERLSKVVSEIPVSDTTVLQDYHADAASDDSGAESDPTELYHRDFGTQTSPSLSRRPSDVENQGTGRAKGPESLVTGHQNRLQILKSHLRDVLEDGEREDGLIEDGKNQVKDLGHYLDTLTYPALNYSNYNYDASYGTDHGSKNTKDDAIDAVKKEIRAVKGVLLSARNFPSGTRVAAK